MENKKNRDSVIHKFYNLSLHSKTIDYLLSLGNELKNYHYYDLIKLNSIEIIKNLSEENQLKLMENIIENRRKININNKNALMLAFISQNSCDFPTNLWTEMLISKVKDLEQLYTYTQQAMNGIDKADKYTLATVLKLHSIKNLDSIIRIKQSIVN